MTTSTAAFEPCSYDGCSVRVTEYFCGRGRHWVCRQHSPPYATTTDAPDADSLTGATSTWEDIDDGDIRLRQDRAYSLYI